MNLLSATQRRRAAAFTLVELLVVIAIIGVLIGLLLPAVQAARESSRRAWCANNMKQIGLATHSYYEARSRLPPLVNCDHGYSVWVHLMPFAEQQSNFDLLNSVNTDNWKDWIFAGFTEAQQTALGSIPYMLCPTRRSGVQYIGGPPISKGANGPLSDYSAVGYSTATTWFNQYLYPNNTNEVNNTASMLRVGMPVARVAGTNSYDDSPCGDAVGRDTYARVTDGLSKTAMFGEKGLGRDMLKNCCNATSAGDGSYLFASSSYREFAVASSIRQRLGRGPSDNANPFQGQGHGSWHPDICQFVFGDASVRAINTNISQATLEYLGHVSDGAALRLDD